MDDDTDAKVSAKLKQTKFPVARIKRIMQKDDEVGKVAQATPIVISKALELFLSKLVEDTARVTTGRGAKRVEAYHLKHTIETIDSFDFLRELVASVPDPSAGGTIPMHEPSSGGAAGADDSDDEGLAPKKRRGRRKKDADADEVDAPVEKKRRGRKPKEPTGEGEAPKKRGRKKKEEPPLAIASGWATASRPQEPEPTHQEPVEEEDRPTYDDDVPVRDDEDEYDDQDDGYGGGYNHGGYSGGSGWR